MFAIVVVAQLSELSSRIRDSGFGIRDTVYSIRYTDSVEGCVERGGVTERRFRQYQYPYPKFPCYPYQYSIGLGKEVEQRNTGMALQGEVAGEGEGLEVKSRGLKVMCACCTCNVICCFSKCNK